jgi:hypothetical protein
LWQIWAGIQIKPSQNVRKKEKFFIKSGAYALLAIIWFGFWLLRENENGFCWVFSLPSSGFRQPLCRPVRRVAGYPHSQDPDRTSTARFEGHRSYSLQAAAVHALRE